MQSSDETTSPSSKGPSTPASSISAASRHGQFNCDADESISIDQYIPVGTIFLTRSDQKHLNAPVNWEELPISALSQPGDYTIPCNSPLLDYMLYRHVMNLHRARWIKICVPDCQMQTTTRWRIYVLPDDVGRRFICRSDRTLRTSLRFILQMVDVSLEAWASQLKDSAVAPFDVWATAEDCSLFYLFNTLPSPSPCVSAKQDIHSVKAMQWLLDQPETIQGLKSTLYPYQRRSSALMLQRETSCDLHLDPKLESRRTPDGQTYYYGPTDTTFLRNPRYYEALPGGILAETMGLGKLSCASR